MKNVIFFGTPEIAKVALEAIYKLSDVKVCAVFCQPDKINSRNNKISFSPVKQFCMDNNIECYQPENINSAYEQILSLNPDVIITCAYGQFIGEKILNIPKYRCVNFHASLLPKYRGGAPIHWVIINGETKTGFSLMYMEKKMDAGDVIKKYEIDIDQDDTYCSLYQKLCELLKDIIRSDFNIIFDSNVVATKQDEPLVSFGLNIKKEQTYINFNNLAKDIYNLVRGLNDKPVARIFYKDNEIKVFETKITSNKSTMPPGTITCICKEGICVATNDYDIFLVKIQLPSKKPMYVSDFINGNHIFVLNDVIKNNFI